MKKYFIITLAIIFLILLGYFFGGRKIVDTYPIEVLQEQSITSTPTASTNQEKGEVNRDATTTTVHYIDFKNGFEVDLTGKDYEVVSSTVYFGPWVQNCEGVCGDPLRQYSVIVVPSDSPQNIEKTFRHLSETYEDLRLEWEKKIINGRVVYYSTRGEACPSLMYEVVGKKNNYVVAAHCGTNDPEKDLLRVVESMKFFDQKKIVIDEHNAQKFSEEYCLGEFSDQPVTKSVVYTNKEKGVSFRVPYNPEWKFKEFVLAPYFGYGSYLQFGSALSRVPESGCMIYRRFTMYFEPVQSADEIIKEATERNARPAYVGIKMTTNTEKINNLSVLKIHYENTQPPEYFSCDYTDIYVLGKKYNYRFDADCVGASTSEVNEVIKTMKLIN